MVSEIKYISLGPVQSYSNFNTD